MSQQINLLNPLLRKSAELRTPVQLVLPFGEPAAFSPRPASLSLIEVRASSPASYCPIGMPEPVFESARHGFAQMPPPR